jgi:S-adenosylmethionine/arginine decarboxylase-like enzyme
MPNKTRKTNRPSTKVQHHHLLLRMELETCPHENDKEKVRIMIDNIIKDINMKSLASPHVYYMKYPRFNEGLTGIAPIETSHIAFHFWNRPDPRFLNTANSNCLLEFDIYTCGTLSTHNIGKVLHHLTIYRPVYADVTLIDRSRGLTIDRHMHWNSEKGQDWTEWLKSRVFQ